jgi:hypothetical protein
MIKEFVPYQPSFDMKELGFDEPCFGYYTGDKKHLVLRPNMGRRNEDLNDIVCTSPLYQQAFRWLLVLANKDEHFSNKWTISYNEDYYSLFLGGCNMGVFKAELECLKKLIEIVKDEKRNLTTDF